MTGTDLASHIPLHLCDQPSSDVLVLPAPLKLRAQTVQLLDPFIVLMPIHHCPVLYSGAHAAAGFHLVYLKW